MKRLLLGLALLVTSSLAAAAVNINTATKEELEALPGIGAVKAQAILDYRKANGPFKSTQDVMKVKGIKEGEFGKIRGEISTSGATTVPAAPQREASKAPSSAPARTTTPAAAAPAPPAAASVPSAGPAAAEPATPATAAKDTGKGESTSKANDKIEKAAKAREDRLERQHKAREEKAAKEKEAAAKGSTVESKTEKSAKADKTARDEKCVKDEKSAKDEAAKK